MTKSSNNLTTSFPSTENVYVKKSLNKDYRRQQLIKITMENQAILKRLQAKSATYSVEKWQQEYNRQGVYRDQIAREPYQFGSGPELVGMTSRISAGNSIFGGRVTTAGGGGSITGNFSVSEEPIPATMDGEKINLP